MTHKLVPFDLHQLGVLRLLFAIGVPLLVLGMPGWWIARRRAGTPAPVTRSRSSARCAPRR